MHKYKKKQSQKVTEKCTLSTKNKKYFCIVAKNVFNF